MNVRLPMLDNALPLYPQCQAVANGDSGQEWTITGIEIYTQPDYSLDSLVGDDVPFAKLPESSQMQLSAHIETHWQSIQAVRYFARVHDMVVSSLFGGSR